MSTIILVRRLADMGFLGFLESYDPDVGNDTVTGDVKVTQDPKKAKKFGSIADAMAFALQQSTRVPLRPDGKPNRPLMAFTLDFKKVDDHET